MDDVLSLADGYDQQMASLMTVYEFGRKHKLEWGLDKCKVMELGSNGCQKNRWKLGDDEIESCDSYKYLGLGEIITSNGKNNENLCARFNKVKATVRAINTCGDGNVMRRIEVDMIIKLHIAVTLPYLLYNAETWPLTTTDKKDIDKIEIWAWKNMLGLPKTTPTAAIVFATGSLYASIRVQVKQLIYLHKVLQKEDKHWAKMTLQSFRAHATLLLSKCTFC